MFVALGNRSAFGLMYWRREEMKLMGKVGQVEEMESAESDMDALEVPLL
jgi:hypothetical protein